MSNNKGAIALDLDGTLLVGESLSEANRLAVKEAADSGYHVLIATARWRQMAERIAAEIGLSNHSVIACSGAQVYCTKTQSDVYDSRLPIPFVERLFKICNDNRCIATATLTAHTWLKIDQYPGDDYVSDELRWVEQLPDVDDAPRIATLQGSATIQLVRDLVEREYSDQINIFDSIGPTGKIIITITAKDADKGIALKNACEYLGVAKENAIAFGDADNDVAMFEAAGRSVAMGQADDDVKAKATDVTLNHTDDGVAHFIRANLL